MHEKRRDGPGVVLPHLDSSDLARLERPGTGEHERAVLRDVVAVKVVERQMRVVTTVDGGVVAAAHACWLEHKWQLKAGKL